MEGFRDAIDVCGLADLCFEGRNWTYEKKVTGSSYCRVRLDRALATTEWSEHYPLAVVRHLTAAASDHVPIILSWRQDEPISSKKKKFKYEMMWETHDDFSSTLAEVWEGPELTSLQDLQRKLGDVSGHLQRWERTTFVSIRRELRKLNAEQERLQSDPMRVGPTYAELKIKERIMELNHREEIMWRQRSRIMWLAEGDRNTRFFHLRARRRKRRNKISKLKKDNGDFTESEEEMRNLTRDFYGNLFHSEGVHNMEAVLDTVPVKVTSEMNDKLLMPFMGLEIKEALFQMFPTKAPGPDGFPAHFFQRHWDLCGAHVTTVVPRVLHEDDDPKVINTTGFRF